ncbi:MAG: nicotinate-nucleotide adenylyltransferase [Legionella sp.]|nr:nicotinate-nucleotide adenylyltransferase [Legionella sp.]
MDNLLIFGGTFDPVHNGHINTAIAIQKHFNFDHFIFLPCKIPLLKNDSIASPEERLAMLNLAIEEHPSYHFEIDTREMTRHTPSYMVTTLEDYRQEKGNGVSITLLMGADTFEQLHRWYKWERLLQLANILVIERPGSHDIPPILAATLQKHETADKMAIINRTNGLIYRFNAGLYDESSTSIRQQLSENQSVSLSLPKAIADYITTNNVYGRSQRF